MKCTLRKIYILDFKSVPRCELYSLNGKYRLIIKGNHTLRKNTYFEYFKTLEYGSFIREL